MVTLHIQLERLGYHVKWESANNCSELFYALGFKAIKVNDESSSKFECSEDSCIFLCDLFHAKIVLLSSKLLRKSDVYCLERVIVGSAPALDNLNRTKSTETGI